MFSMMSPLQIFVQDLLWSIAVKKDDRVLLVFRNNIHPLYSARYYYIHAHIYLPSNLSQLPGDFSQYIEVLK